MKVQLVSFKHPELTSDEFQEGDVFVSASGSITKGIISTFEVSASKMLELPIATTSFLTNNKIPPFGITLCLEPEWCLRHVHAK